MSGVRRRRVLGTVLVMLSLSMVLVASARAQSTIPEYDSEYDIRAVYLLPSPDEHQLALVVTGERRLTSTQATTVCEDIGLDRHLITMPARINRQIVTVVICIGEMEPQTGSIDVSGIVAGDDVALFSGACADVDLSIDIPLQVVIVSTETTVNFPDLAEGLYCVVLNGGMAEALDNASDVFVTPEVTSVRIFSYGTLDVAVTNAGVATQGQTVRFYEANAASDNTDGGAAVENCAGTQIGQDVVDGGDHQANALVVPGTYCVEVDSLNGTDAELADVAGLERGEIDATLEVTH
jgi:hypothetical protein